MAIFIDGQGSNAAAATRVGGEDAADLIGGKFRVYATNTGGVVFNNYEVKWEGTASLSPSNRVGWEYQGYMSKSDVPAIQNIKFWDLGQPRYDFVAFAGLSDSQKILSTATNTFRVNSSNMYDLYFANRISASPVHQAPVAGVSPEFIAYGTNVKLVFRRATSRIRIGFYEMIPGYAVTNLRFYYGDNSADDQGTSTKTQAGLEGEFPTDGDYIITYDADNVAHAQFDPSGTIVNSRNVGNLTYTKAESTVPGLPFLMADGSPSIAGEEVFLGTTSATATYAISTENIDGITKPNCQWHPILPNETNATPLKLRVDYTLVALDGEGEKIEVKGAEAEVPVINCQWRPNYSYTYIFKISTNSGFTGNQTDPKGLYPISFDAEVSEIIDEMITHEEELKNNP